MAYAWVVTPPKVQTVIHKIVEVSQPQKVILFGSYVNGDIGINSDLDVLVVTGNHIENPRKESIRIRRVLRGIRMPMDILVVPEAIFEDLANVPGLIYREALRSGKVVYESNWTHDITE
ncbi:MAG: nucleotidyltransferase domain-containing protein [Deltaproteobacteria bacterium]|nr:nucleotidyltransferase domain-containing protein [Deltaproteobacteria bacterium]